jgi:6,7-dimethyl-8-ribityllumazine synthase
MNIIKPKDIEAPFRVGIVVSRFNEQVTQRLYEGALIRLNELKITTDLITVAWVPGAMELPIAAQTMIDTGAFNVIIVYGAVIMGETDHYNIICDTVSRGCQQVSLENGVPVIYGVLTTKTELQALDHAGGGKGNLGRECVDIAFETLSVLRQIDETEF